MKQKIIFILKCTLVILPFVITMLFTAFFPFGYMDIEYPAWKYTRDISYGKSEFNTAISKNNSLMETNSDNKTVVILGDSRAMADLIPDILDEGENAEKTTTYNLATGGATPIEMYYTLNRFIERNEKPSKVIIMFAPFHYSIIDNYDTRTEYFNFLSLKEWTDLIDSARIAKSETVLHEGYYNDMLSCRFRFPDKYLPALVNAKAFTRYTENKNEYEKIKAARGYGEFGTANGCSELNFEATYEYMHTTGDAILIQLYMNRLLSLCIQNGIDTVVAIPPMNETSFNALKDTYVEDFTEYLSELSFSYPEILIDKTIPHMPDEYFGDSSHLNRSGAERFCIEFKEKY